MEWLIFLFIAAGALIVIYTCIQFFRFFLLRKKLNHTDTDIKGYTKVLGDDYRSRAVDTKTRRCKWDKGIFVVRAHFDEDGNLVGKKNITTRIFSNKKEISWN